MDNQGSVGYVVLGAALALATSLTVEIYKQWTANKGSQKDFKIILKLEIKGILETVTKLIDEYGQKQFFLFSVISELNTKGQRLDKIRDKVIFIRDDVKKEEILSLFNAIANYHSDVLTVESNAFNSNQNKVEGATPVPWNADIYKSQRQMLAFKGTDLKRSIQDLVNYLER